MSKVNGRYEVFLSHAGQDLWIAERLADAATRAGASPFLCLNDADITREYEEELFDHVNSCDELLVLLTPWSRERPYVIAEIAVARARDIPIGILLLGIEAESLRS